MMRHDLLTVKLARWRARWSASPERAFWIVVLGVWFVFPVSCGGGGSPEVADTGPEVLRDILFAWPDPGRTDVVPGELGKDVPASDSGAENVTDTEAFDASGKDAGPSCGDKTCSATESCKTCPEDCGPCPPACGDGECHVSENCATCAKDCGPCPNPCGNGACDSELSETCATCPADCGHCPSCGDGTCEPPETCGTCPLDCDPCPPFCGDKTCNGDETCLSCTGDCGACKPTCGDGVCSGTEDCHSCDADCGACGPFCGDGACNGVETCVECEADCGACSSACGDGFCVGLETCATCPGDCGPCSPTLSFNLDWTETLTGPLVAGRKMKIHYDPGRLPTCRATHNGYPGWTITVFYTFDLAKEAIQAQVVVHEGSQSKPFDPEIVLPETATQVWFWANNTDTSGCVAWDSDYQKNYLFPIFSPTEIAADVGWAGNVQFVYLTEGGPKPKGDVDPAYFFDTMLGSELVTYIQAEVYVKGITDRQYQNAAVEGQVARTALNAWVRTNFLKGGGPEKPLAPLALEPLGRTGNNFVYRWYPGNDAYIMQNGPFAEGAYAYVLEFRSAEGVNAAVLDRPGSPGEPRVFVYGKAGETACKLFLYNPPSDYCPK